MASYYGPELMHYGVKGQKKGVRRYQDYGKGGYIPKETGVYIAENTQQKSKQSSKKYNKVKAKKRPTYKELMQRIRRKRIFDAFVSEKHRERNEGYKKSVSKMYRVNRDEYLGR